MKLEENIIEIIKQEFIDYGEFNNSLKLVDSLITAKCILNRRNCTLDELIQGIKEALICQINKIGN